MPGGQATALGPDHSRARLTRRPNPVNDSGPSSKTGAVPLRRGLGACIDRATRMLQPLQTARDFDARSDEFGQRGALISWAHEQRRTVKWRAGALAIGALGRRRLEVGFSPGPARVIASLCGSDVGPRAGSWRVHGPADRSDSKSPRRLGATGSQSLLRPASAAQPLRRFDHSGHSREQAARRSPRQARTAERQSNAASRATSPERTPDAHPGRSL